MMWDSPVYAVNMFYYHWSKKKLLWAYGSSEYIKAGNPSRDRGGKKKSGRCHVAAEGERHQNLTGKPQPCGNMQVNINGLI